MVSRQGRRRHTSRALRADVDGLNVPVAALRPESEGAADAWSTPTQSPQSVLVPLLGSVAGESTPFALELGRPRCLPAFVEDMLWLAARDPTLAAVALEAIVLYRVRCELLSDALGV